MFCPPTSTGFSLYLPTFQSDRKNGCLFDEGTVAGACQSTRMRPQHCWMNTIWVVRVQLRQVASDCFKVIPQMQWLPIRGNVHQPVRCRRQPEALPAQGKRVVRVIKVVGSSPSAGTLFTSKSPLKTTCKLSCFENLHIVYIKKGCLP